MAETIADTLPTGVVSDVPDSITLDGDDRYRPDGVIGKGGMGVVHARIDRRIGRRVACKELRPDVAADPALRARFVREARVQGQLEHPAIVPVYDIGVRDDGAPYFTMKGITGGVTLADVIAALAKRDVDAEHKYARHRVLAAFSRICLAIDYAHARGVLHRDLKPANLMLGEYGEVYVLDWGLAKVSGETELDASVPTSGEGVTQADAMLGTPGYMAPEQIDDPRTVGPEADVYALGAILYELLALAPLHPRGLEALTTTRQHVDARMPDAPPELEAAVVAATALEPARRGTARALADLIERYLEGERDHELRRNTAARHARDAAEAARAGASGDLDARQRAMREINKAMALDPTNVLAKTTMHELFSTLPATTPEVEDQIQRKFRGNMRWISGVGAGVYTSVLGFIAIVMWMGVREVVPVVGFFAAMMVTIALSVAVWRMREPSAKYVLASVITTFVGFGIASRFVSPLVLVPCAVAVNATGYAVFVRPRHRWFVGVAASAAFVVPLVLELAGVLAPSFDFDAGRLVVLPTALDLPRVPTLALVIVASVAGVLIGTVIMGYIRDRLATAERRLYLYNWQLRQLLEIEMPAMTKTTSR